MNYREARKHAEKACQQAEQNNWSIAYFNVEAVRWVLSGPEKWSPRRKIAVVASIWTVLVFAGFGMTMAVGVVWQALT